MSGRQNEYHCAYHELGDPELLTPHPRNPNTHPKKQMEALCASIKEYGWRHVVTVSKLTGYVVSGHARRLAGIALNCVVPIVYQSFENEAEELAYVIADNRIAELAATDTGLLSAGLEWLAKQGASMVSVGFDDYVPPDWDKQTVPRSAEGKPPLPQPETDAVREDSAKDRIGILFDREIAGDVLRALRSLRDEHGEESITWKQIPN